MKEKDKPITYIIVGAVALIAALLIMGVISSPLSVSDRADLRLISQPYVEATDIKDLCLASGASWTEDKDFVGCQGIGPNSCSTAIVLAGQSQCIGAGADFFCQTGVQGAIYCTY